MVLNSQIFAVLLEPMSTQTILGALAIESKYCERFGTLGVLLV